MDNIFSFLNNQEMNYIFMEIRQLEYFRAIVDAGKTLYEQAGNLLMLADLTKQEVVKSGQAATLHIGITPSTVSMMSEYLLYFAKKYPQIHFDVHEGSTFTLKDQLENGMIDLTTLRTPIVLNGCETKSLFCHRHCSAGILTGK